MKTTTLAILTPLALLLSWSARADYVERDAAFTYVQYSPQFDFYDGAWGVEGEMRRWIWKDESFGWSAQIGIHNWDINDRPSQITAIQEITSVRGSASFLLGGLSLIYRTEITDRLRPMFELGTRFNYGLTSATANIPTGPDSSTRGRGIDIASQITGQGSVNVDYRFNNDWILFIGGGYQFDIVQGEISYASQTIADNELAGPFARLAIIFEY